MKKTEIFLWGLLIITTILRTIFNTTFLAILASGAILSIFYFLFTMPLLNNISLKSIFNQTTINNIKTSRIFGSLLTGLSFSLLSIAIMFKALAWPGSLILLFLSVIAIILIFLISSIKLKKNKEKTFYKPLKTRCIILICIAIIFTTISFLPNETQQEIFPLTQKHKIDSMN